MAKLDDRYPFVYRAREGWGKVGVSLSRGDDFIRITTLLEDRPGGRWAYVDLVPEEAEQMALRLLERVNAYRNQT